MKTIKELWNDLFDSSLERYKSEDETIRNLSMILHVLKLEYKKASKCITDLKRESNAQKKTILDYKQKVTEPVQSCGCKNNNRTPLKTLSDNYNETTPNNKSYLKQNINISFDIIGNEDIFNHQISELDLNVPKENEETFVVDDSVENIEMATSPTLHKHKKKLLSRKKIKKENIENISLKDIVIMDTPTAKVNKSKKFKQLKLTMCSSVNNATKPTNCTVTRNEITNAHESTDIDETLFLPEQQKDISSDKPQGDTEVLEILQHLKENASNKRIKLDNSYDCFPERENYSPDFAYKREAVRKKSERMKLQGWDCPDCEKYYSTYKNKLSDEELKKRMDQCSRHRYKFNPNILTPQGFWNPDFSPTQDSIAFNI